MDKYEVGDVVRLKKQHPCGSSEWEILRVGADFRLKCTGCGHQIMIARKLVEKITKEQLNTEEGKKIIGQAGDLLKEGGLVAFPTETVYGLGADALNKTASTKIYEAKGRPSDNPLIVHIAEYVDLRKIAVNIPAETDALAAHFWPGPLTMIFQKTDLVLRL